LEYKWRKTMNEKQLLQAWKEEENVAHIRGWDFSHIAGRHTEDTNFPWDYKQRILTDLSPDMKLLDVDTGGGEFLLSLGHPKENTSATEAYPPNAKLCRDTLIPMGIDFREAVGNSSLPFEDESFHMVIDRHGDYNAQEFYRILKKGGLVVMQQVGAENDAAVTETFNFQIFEKIFDNRVHDRLGKFPAVSGFGETPSGEIFGIITAVDKHRHSIRTPGSTNCVIGGLFRHCRIKPAAKLEKTRQGAG